MEPLSLAKLKETAALQASKHRAMVRQVLVEGVKLTQEALASGWRVRYLVGTEARLTQFPALPASIPVYRCTERDLARISTQDQPEGLLCVVDMPPPAPVEEGVSGPAFVLWRVQDPGNLGALLRIADWFGHPRLYCTPDTVAWHNPKAVRASMGAIFRVGIRPIATLAWLSLQTSRTAAAVLQGPPPQNHLHQRDLLLLGSESHGLPQEVLALPDLATVSIPGRGGAESLNVAVAGGILAYAHATLAA